MRQKYEKPRYECHPLGNRWIVYRIVGGDEMKVGDFKTWEEAQREAERLTGRGTGRTGMYGLFYQSMKSEL